MNFYEAERVTSNVTDKLVHYLVKAILMQIRPNMCFYPWLDWKCLPINFNNNKKLPSFHQSDLFKTSRPLLVFYPIE